MARSGFFFLSLLHFFLTTTAVNGYLLNGRDTLLDVKGNPVEPGVEYYIVSANGGMGGGVKSTKVSTYSSCPAYVGQESYDADAGTSVTLRSVNDREAEFLRSNEKIIVEFSAVETCIWSPAVWTVEESDGEKLLVTGGDPPKYPPPVGIGNNMFTFRRSGASPSTYTMGYCRCNLCSQSCDPVGQTSVNGQTILKVEPNGDSAGFPIVLVKAGDEIGEDLRFLIQTSTIEI